MRYSLSEFCLHPQILVVVASTRVFARACDIPPGRVPVLILPLLAQASYGQTNR